MGTVIHGGDTGGIGLGTTGNLKRDEGVVVVAGVAKVITFAVAFPDADWVLSSIRCYTASGDNNDYTITNKIAAGFTITPTTNGFVDYTAIIQ